MGIAGKLVDRLYTHDDLENFPEGEVWELIEGVPHQMAPPSVRHQKIATELVRQFANYLLGKPCDVYAAPFGIYLPNTKNKNNFCVPDLTVVCEPIEGPKYYGIPSLVVEIISPSNNGIVQLKKFKLYQNFGVKEYWLIYPDNQIVSVYKLNQNNKYELADFDEEERKIKVGIFEDLWIDLNLVFGKRAKD